VIYLIFDSWLGSYPVSGDVVFACIGADGFGQTSMQTLLTAVAASMPSGKVAHRNDRPGSPATKMLYSVLLYDVYSLIVLHILI
jgi:hypothetical protein